MVLNNVISINVTETHYIIEQGITPNCSKIMIDRNNLELFITINPHEGEIVVLVDIIKF